MDPALTKWIADRARPPAEQVVHNLQRFASERDARVLMTWLGWSAWTADVLFVIAESHSVVPNFETAPSFTGDAVAAVERFTRRVAS